MPIVQFPDRNVFPNKPRTTHFTQLLSASSTYYTVLNITSGRGIINRILMLADRGGNPNYVEITNLFLRITIDNDSAYVVNCTTTEVGSFLRGRFNGTGYGFNVGSTTSNLMNLNVNSRSLLYVPNCFYRNNVLIEVMQNNANNYTLSALVDYSTE